VLVGQTLDVTLALKPHQKVLLKFAHGRVFAGFFDKFQVLLVLPIACFGQSSKLLLPAATIRVGILEDLAAGTSPTIDLVGAPFLHFRKEDLQMGKRDGVGFMLGDETGAEDSGSSKHIAAS